MPVKLGMVLVSIATLILVIIIVIVGPQVFQVVFSAEQQIETSESLFTNSNDQKSCHLAGWLVLETFTLFNVTPVQDVSCQIRCVEVGTI
jgi:Trk-type K+ transport system membrane component